MGRASQRGHGAAIISFLMAIALKRSVSGVAKLTA